MEQPQQQQQKGAVAAPAANGSGGGDLVGYVDVHVKSARDIQNICIYHKQDVYARVSLPGEGAPVASTQVVNGGGRSPVFDQSLRLGVRAGDVDAALRCEVWMLSRVKNYLQDQLLGFALVPLAEVVAADGGTLAREFQLTTNDLFQTPSGFLQLELAYIGAVPEVVPISPTPKPALADPDQEPENAAGAGNGKGYEKIEFPDLNLVEENQIMVSEYTGLPCKAVEPQSSESLLTSAAATPAQSSRCRTARPAVALAAVPSLRHGTRAPRRFIPRLLPPPLLHSAPGPASSGAPPSHSALSLVGRPPSRARA